MASIHRDSLSQGSLARLCAVQPTLHRAPQANIGGLATQSYMQARQRPTAPQRWRGDDVPHGRAQRFSGIRVGRVTGDHDPTPSPYPQPSDADIQTLFALRMHQDLGELDGSLERLQALGCIAWDDDDYPALEGAGYDLGHR